MTVLNKDFVFWSERYIKELKHMMSMQEPWLDPWMLMIPQEPLQATPKHQTESSICALFCVA